MHNSGNYGYGNLNPTMNRRQRRQKPQREFNNKKGIQMVVVGNYKYKKVFQRIGNKTIVHTILVHPV
ncbi:hypothetical protein [Chryseobacterium sp.]|uniref:hypothetical protein n=1 Tax=Chryseobacterium sp. TaxID=1871047 RepID=UPI0012AA741D|nr:hypothetical protein [Chryseobacterium sp.]QFG53668.1 hypothetical protein F7R58_08915 [Chryseobacterium sp.]